MNDAIGIGIIVAWLLLALLLGFGVGLVLELIERCFERDEP